MRDLVMFSFFFVLMAVATGIEGRAVSESDSLKLSVRDTLDPELHPSSVRQIGGDYFMAKADSSLLMLCSITQSLEISKTEIDALRIESQMHWTLTSNNEEEGAKAILADISDSKCSVGLLMTKEARSGEKRMVEARCESLLSVEDITERFHAGIYNCNATMRAVVGDNDNDNDNVLMEISSGREAAIFVEEMDLAKIIVTSLIVSILGLILIALICCRLAGHKFAWEYVEFRESLADLQSNAMSRFNSEDSNLWMAGRNNGPRSRHLSTASSMQSGIAFQADSESLVRLMERLDRVEDVISDKSSESGLLRKGKEAAKVAKEETSNVANDNDDHHQQQQQQQQQQPPYASACELNPIPEQEEESRKTSTMEDPMLSASAHPLSKLISSESEVVECASSRRHSDDEDDSETESGRSREWLNARRFSRLVKRTAKRATRSSGGGNLKRGRSLMGLGALGGAGGMMVAGDDALFQELLAIERERKVRFGDRPGPHVHTGPSAVVHRGSQIAYASPHRRLRSDPKRRLSLNVPMRRSGSTHLARSQSPLSIKEEKDDVAINTA